MKKLFFGILLATISLITWLSIRQPTVVSAQGGGCAINFATFDIKIYDQKMTDTILFDNKLIADKTIFLKAIETDQLPFKTLSADESILQQAIDTINKDVCGGKCDEKALSMSSTCADNLSISLAQSIYLDRIANMSLCQKDVFDSMQLKNNDYLEVAKKNNSAYYLAIAPITNAFRRDYFATNDKGQRQVILDKYRLDNSLLRKELYKDQAEVLGKFIVDINKLSKTFAECK